MMHIEWTLADRIYKVSFFELYAMNFRVVRCRIDACPTSGIVLPRPRGGHIASAIFALDLSRIVFTFDGADAVGQRLMAQNRRRLA